MEDLVIDYNKPTTEEIKRAIRHIQNGKAAGPDCIPASTKRRCNYFSGNSIVFLRKSGKNKKFQQNGKKAT